MLYDSADYRRAEEALDTALGLCRVDGDESTEVACVTCLAYVLRERGEWSRASEMCRELIDAGSVRLGRAGAARRDPRLPGQAQRRAAHAGRLAGDLRAARPLPHVDRLDRGRSPTWRRPRARTTRRPSTSASCSSAGSDCEDHHFAVWGLHWASGYLAGRGDRAGAHACAEALTRIASTTGHPYALAALAHAIGETALLDGDADTAAEQLARAVEIHRGLDVPFERAQIELRAGVALAAAGDRETALERLGGAYRTARKLGARPLAAEAATEVATLGGSVSRRVERARARALTRRELEVVRLIAVGRTNRDVAQELFLSPRTVDMHVRHILRKLDCHSRVEAAHRAHELGLCWPHGHASTAAGSHQAAGLEAARLRRSSRPASSSAVRGIGSCISTTESGSSCASTSSRLSAPAVGVPVERVERPGHDLAARGAPRPCASPARGCRRRAAATASAAGSRGA